MQRRGSERHKAGAPGRARDVLMLQVLVGRGGGVMGKEGRPVGQSRGQKPFHSPEDFLGVTGAGDFAVQCKGGFMMKSDPGS